MPRWGPLTTICQETSRWKKNRTGPETFIEKPIVERERLGGVPIWKPSGEWGDKEWAQELRE